MSRESPLTEGTKRHFPSEESILVYCRQTWLVSRKWGTSSCWMGWNPALQDITKSAARMLPVKVYSAPATHELFKLWREFLSFWMTNNDPSFIRCGWLRIIGPLVCPDQSVFLWSCVWRSSCSKCRWWLKRSIWFVDNASSYSGRGGLQSANILNIVPSKVKEISGRQFWHYPTWALEF